MTGTGAGTTAIATTTGAAMATAIATTTATATTTVAATMIAATTTIAAATTTAIATMIATATTMIDAAMTTATATTTAAATVTTTAATMIAAVTTAATTAGDRSGRARRRVAVARSRPDRSVARMTPARPEQSRTLASDSLGLCSSRLHHPDEQALISAARTSVAELCYTECRSSTNCAFKPFHFTKQKQSSFIQASARLLISLPRRPNSGLRASARCSLVPSVHRAKSRHQVLNSAQTGGYP
mmetsp:Transcript_1361/g.4035  ORF Transcript_1361/g.4035 Transcript_1361/m.4035 type:complete len:243 (-) Transcript_1361:167-895(-)